MSNIHQINDFLKNILDPREMGDYAINGIQVENDGEIERVSFAVDCSMEAIVKAAEDGSQLMIVHHGIFWGKPVPISSNHRARIRMLLEKNIGLIAYHLPLDCHGEYGNNIRIMKKLGIAGVSPFGSYKGIQLGYLGISGEILGIDDICRKLGIVIDGKIVRYLDFGVKEITKIAVVSGGGGSCFEEAAGVKADLFITGDAEHELYHAAKENGINVLFAGHYFTETFGVKALQELIGKEFGIDTVFYEIPTGL
jgi:dinuclear metal center YbgI/SA1388 family protein